MAYYAEYYGQDFGYEEENNFSAAQTQYFAHSDVPQHQELFQEEESSVMYEIMKMQLELLHQMNSHMGSLKDSIQSISASLDAFKASQQVADSEGMLDSMEPKPEDVDISPVGEESEVHDDRPLVIQVGTYAGLPTPLEDLFPCDVSAVALHFMIPCPIVKLKNEFLKLDHTFLDNDIVIRDACFDNSLISHYDNCRPDYDTMVNVALYSHHVPYCYTYIIGYSIDDLVGVCPITTASCSLSAFRLSFVHHSLRANMVRDDIPWDPGGCVAWW